ncbi:MAG: aminoacyl-tRNA hydrolase [Chloroherpetonaceae bacterium]
MFFSKAKANSKPTFNQNFDYLIVGLGNPKPHYFNNRHNIGYSIVQKIIEEKNLKTYDNSKFYTLYLEENQDHKVLFALPLTYMNESGIAIRKIIAKHKIPIEKVVVIVDEYNFPLGKIHLKQGGSDGGHNGIASIITELQNPNFIRLRCGISRNFGPGELIDYVLSDFSQEEIPFVNAMRDKAERGIYYLIENGLARASSDINASKI